jgi:hypothetical protein
MKTLQQLHQLFRGHVRIPLVLGIGLVALILGEVAWFSVSRSPLSETEVVDPTTSFAMLGLSIPSPTTAPPLGQFGEVLRRPVFEPDRKPVNITVQAKKAGVIDAAELARTWRLTGVVISGERSFGMLEHQKTGEAIALNLKESIDGWRLTNISEGAIELRSAQGVAELTLYRQEANDAKRIAAKNGVLVRKKS